MDKKKRTGLILSILGVISIVLITAGVTWAFFSYTREGEQTNTITAGAITFKYDEGQTAFTLNNALPMSDASGATQTATNKYSFSVSSTTPTGINIPYVVTLRKDPSSTLPESQVKVYLKAGSAANSTADSTTGIQTGAITQNSSTVKVFSALDTVGTGDYAWFNATYKSNLNASDDKIIFTGTVAANSASYTEYFDLGMWLLLDTSQNSTMVDYSAYEFVRSNHANTAAGESVSALRSTECNDYINTSNYTGPAILTSTEYYALDDDVRSLFRRIAYVNYNTGYVVAKADITLSETQAVPSGDNWSESEQFYPMNGKTFTVRVNVYAKGATVNAG